MSVADLVSRLIASGTPAEVAAVVVTEAFAAGVASGKSTGLPVDKTAERRREFDRIRKANKRKTDAEKSAMSGGSPRKSGGSPVEMSGNAPLSILTSLTFTDEPLTEEKKERGVDVLSTEPRARKRGARLPDDWEPSEVDRKYAAGRGLRLVEIEIEATKFRNYWTNRTDKQAAKPRWDRAWENWVLSIRGGSQNGMAPRPGSKDDTRERTVNALRSLNPFPYADDVGRGQGPGAPIPGQLSLVKPARS